MTTERLLELVMLTNTFDSIIHASGVNENGEIEFEGGIYDVKAMVARQTELFKRVYSSLRSSRRSLCD